MKIILLINYTYIQKILQLLIKSNRCNWVLFTSVFTNFIFIAIFVRNKLILNWIIKFEMVHSMLYILSNLAIGVIQLFKLISSFYPGLFSLKLFLVYIELQEKIIFFKITRSLIWMAINWFCCINLIFQLCLSKIFFFIHCLFHNITDLVLYDLRLGSLLFNSVTSTSFPIQLNQSLACRIFYI